MVARFGARVSNMAVTPAGHDQRPGNLHEHGKAIEHVVAVVRRREPGEIHPRPPDREEHHQVADEAFERVGRRDRVMQAARRLGDCDDEHQVEQQLQGRGRTMTLVRGARSHGTAQLHSARHFASPSHPEH